MSRSHRPSIAQGPGSSPPPATARSAGRRIAIAVALILGLVMAGAIAAALLAHPSSSAASGSRTEAGAPVRSGTACHDPFVAEIAPSARGHDSPELAARRWATTTEHHPDAPTTDWVPFGASSARSGDWRISETEIEDSGWVVSGLTCL